MSEQALSSIGAALRLIAISAIVVSGKVDGRPLFQDPGLLEIQLRGPLGSLVDRKKDRREYTFLLTAGDASVEVAVRSRGNSRLDICSFPPLRLTFEDRLAEGTVFAGQRHLKLVTHCTTRSRDAGNVLDEYLAYRIFNLVSDVSYRVRLLRLKYFDTDGHLDPDSVVRYGFLIESDEELAQRTGSTPARVEGIVLTRLDPRQAALVYVFEYLIGNTDWSLVTALTEEFCCHNIDVFAVGDRNAIVPYDFDLAGLVDASYAKPDRSLPIRSVTTRRYRGYCIAPSELRAALQHIESLRTEIRRVAETTFSQDPKRLGKRLRFLDGFFEQARDEDRLMRSFERLCL